MRLLARSAADALLKTMGVDTDALDYGVATPEYSPMKWDYIRFTPEYAMVVPWSCRAAVYGYLTVMEALESDNQRVAQQ